MSSTVEDIWKEYTSDLPSEVMDKWWSKIVQRYSEDGRYCHNIQHLEEKFEHFSNVRHMLKNEKAVALAVFFHYLEYDPKAMESEERNVEHFLHFADEAGIQNESSLRNEVKALLSAAASHSTDEHKTKGIYGSEDLHYFLDLDMAVLGSSPEHYAEYTAKVQQEYTFLPESMYKNLRHKVLQTFLQIPNIFASKEFRDKFEAQARTNIQKEVEVLKA